jgi:hypothetical protein
MQASHWRLAKNGEDQDVVEKTMELSKRNNISFAVDYKEVPHLTENMIAPWGTKVKAA